MISQSPRFPLSAITLALLCSGLVAPTFVHAETTDVGTVRITGEGDKLGNGLMIEEDGAKAKSTVTKAAIDKARPSSNPFQLLELQPGVNASSQDATGLFGGNLRVRGFNSDQMGFTVNGAPVNDSGNFAVYPQEYADAENLCEMSITQGSADTDAPHVGASGGNVSLVSCAPKDTAGGKFSQSVGQLNFTRSFLRLDSGRIGETMPLKFYVSYSKSMVDKFKGEGSADRDHVDTGLDWKISADTSLTANLLFNRAINNNIMTLTKAQYAANPNLDYSTTVPQHLTSGNESTTANFGTSSSKTAYYGYALNPFENYLITSRLQSRINDQLTLSAEPYFWYGYGTGGTQQTTLAENSTSGSRFAYGIANINGNGSSSDTVGVYRGSVTETHRPGITFKADWQLDNHKILAGYWIERARHQQTAPATTVSNGGTIADLWLRDNLITYNNGQTYENRNWMTVSTGQSLFLIDKITLLNDRLEVSPGIRYTSIERDFTNHASSGSGVDYEVDRTYSAVLPSLGATYKLSEPLQVFGNVTQNMRAPSNFVLSNWTSNATYVNGQATTYTLTPNNAIKEETATNFEAGLRYNGQSIQGSLALYDVEFKNRIASAYNAGTNSYSDFNVGNSRTRGFELQVGTKPVSGWSLFGSATYTDSKILSDFLTKNGSSLATLATSDKDFPDTPRWMFSASAQYSTGPYMAALTAKYVGRRFTTLMNDESLDPYTIVNFDAGYRFPSAWFLKNPTIRLNITNLFNEHYLLANSGSGSNISATANSAYSTYSGYAVPSYYVGAPRFSSLTFSTEF
jgi:iron complex outermembrane recepter protein